MLTQHHICMLCEWSTTLVNLNNRKGSGLWKSWQENACVCHPHHTLHKPVDGVHYSQVCNIFQNISGLRIKMTFTWSYKKDPCHLVPASMWKLMLQGYTLTVNIYLFHCNSAHGESTTNNTSNTKHAHIKQLNSAHKFIQTTHCLFSLLPLYTLFITLVYFVKSKTMIMWGKILNYI